VAVAGCDVGEKIEADGEVEVAGIEIHKIVGAPRRDAVEQLLGEIAVRIDQPDTVPGGKMLHDEITQQRRFSRTRFADEVEMLTAIRQRKTASAFAAPYFADTDV